MANEKSHFANEILDRVKERYGFNSDARLAEFLGVRPNTISTWRARDSVDFALIIARCEGANLNWLLRGEGEAFDSPTILAGTEAVGASMWLGELAKLVDTHVAPRVEPDVHAALLRIMDRISEGIEGAERERSSVAAQLDLLREIILDLKKG